MLFWELRYVHHEFWLRYEYKKTRLIKGVKKEERFFKSFDPRESGRKS